MALIGVADTWRWCWWWWYAFVVLVRATDPNASSSLVLPADFNFRFTRSTYNVSIPENSVRKTYAVPDDEERMGVIVTHEDPMFGVVVTSLRYRIIAGDREKFFKAESRLVGDFSFLLIRTRTGTVNVLNREKRDRYTLTIEAAAIPAGSENDDDVIRTETSVLVHVLDTNDLSPIFHSSEYKATVREDAPLHTSVLRVSAEDADIGVNGEVYYNLQELSDSFVIHPMSGVISITRHLATSKSSYDLTVEASDRSVAPSQVSVKSVVQAKVKLKVKRVNLHAPEIIVQHLPNVVEQSDSRVYAIVKVTDEDSGVHGQIQSLSITDGDPDGHFRIRPGANPNEFRVEVCELLDREVSPYGYNLTLLARDAGIPTVKETYRTLHVQIADLNDNSPVFERELYAVEVTETAPINTPVVRLKVSDADDGRNAQVRLDIVAGNEGGEFRINAISGVLYTAQNLDAETKSFFTLTVSALDQGHRGVRRQSSAKITVTVTDANDNDPVFEQEEISKTVTENEPTGTSVARVSAKDRDSGDNGYITYSIGNLSPVPFEVDPFTGTVRTTQALDYETMRRDYMLKVRASDWGQPYRRQSELRLKIRLLDANDNRPQFEKKDCTGNVTRDAPIGREIMTLSALDLDAGNVISYRIVAGNEDGCFGLDATTGVLSVTCDLMDVKIDFRELQVAAMDTRHFSDVANVRIHLVKSLRSGGKYSRPTVPTYNSFADDTVTASSSFECVETGVARRLTETLAAAEQSNSPQHGDAQFAMLPGRYGENIHTPELKDFPNEIKVNESTSIGTLLHHLHARDRDLGFNGKLVYVISSGDEDSVFQIGTETGALTVVGKLDRERTADYLLNITVFDLGRPQKSVSRMLPVKILDINDHEPQLTKSVFMVELNENVRNNTQIARLKATDPDLGANGEVGYRLLTDTKDFGVEEKSGRVTVRSKLDREKQSAYELKIVAFDRSPDHPLSSLATIRVIVKDINDNPPLFSTNGQVVKVREDLPVGSLVSVLTAQDPDLDSGGEIRFSIVNGDFGSFIVDSVTGVVRIAKSLDFEQCQVYNVTVRATDQGIPPLKSESYLLIEVADVNENLHAPEFPDFVIETSVKENSPEKTLVTTVTATDADENGEDSRITYSIRGGDGLGYFSIDKDGNIRTLVVLDRETKSSYWLTIYAQDKGVVPLSSRLEVYVEVLDENDNIPLSVEPVYYPKVPENSPANRPVVQVQATDGDRDPLQQLTYVLTAGNPQSLFSINTETGLITTTDRRLDRESQSQHTLEVTISDGGIPALSSTTRVVVTVVDVNDHAPSFLESFYKVRIPATNKRTAESPLYQNESEDVIESPLIESTTGNDTSPILWETSTPESLIGFSPLLRVVAVDLDEGVNADINYSIRSGKKDMFNIHPKTGAIYSKKTLRSGKEFELLVQAMDNGTPPKRATVHVSLDIRPIPENEPNTPPYFGESVRKVRVSEGDRPGLMVLLLKAIDEDGDQLWYHIQDGNEGDVFAVKRDRGDLFLAKPLDWETRSNYNLTVAVTDGIHTVYMQVLVTVIDLNEHRPEFSKAVYVSDVAVDADVGALVMSLDASDADQDHRVFYSIHTARSPASLRAFKVDLHTGRIFVHQKLDAEPTREHILTVLAKDQGTPSERNYARAVITVRDHNDHTPQFTSELLEGKVYETSDIGSRVVQIVAIDMDRGMNGKLTYDIVSGNVGNAFSMDKSFGIVRVARQLDIGSMVDYMLVVRAQDHGEPPLSSTVPLHILVTMADNAPPKFLKSEYATEISENLPPGAFVVQPEARAMSSLYYEILFGDDDDVFFTNPSTGVLTTKRPLDYERKKLYNLTLQVTNMAGAKGACTVVVHILDRNDNAPRFEHDLYEGHVVETASIGSLVLTTDGRPLVVTATDADSELNALLSFHIVEGLPRRFFHIDSNTGAIRSVMTLDHERESTYEFHVRVTDTGSPRLSSDTTALVRITVIDVNDCPPKFLQETYHADLYLPTFTAVTVAELKAVDDDSDSILKYSIISGKIDGKFNLNENSGVLTVANSAGIEEVTYIVEVQVTDGKYSATTTLTVVTMKSNSNNGLTFPVDRYFATILENTTKVSTVTVVNVLGSRLNEHIVFRILNPSEMFEMGITSGVLRTTGLRFDREAQPKYELVIEARSEEKEGEKHRLAHVIVEVSVMDVNDNCPLFVNLPYYAVISVAAGKADLVTKVHAIDLDIGENGEIRYELVRGSGELFRVSRRSGEITLKQSLEGHRKEFELVIAAYDGGVTPCSTEAPVHVKVMDRSMPVFEKQFYSASVPENISPYSSIISLQADSPLRRKLIYSIIQGNEKEEFTIDFNTGTIKVIDKLDYETRSHYQLIIQATDSVTGATAQVPLNIIVEDVNDNPPEFSLHTYNVTVSESTPFGTPILKLEAADNDTGIYGEFRFFLRPGDSQNASEYFHIEPTDGTITLKRQLDHEFQHSHRFSVMATDLGVPSLSSIAHVWIEVKDTNDNSPKFEQPSYGCVLSEQAKRGQFVTMVRASDPDDSDQPNLVYSIIGGNEQQTFSIDSHSGIISLTNLHKFAEHTGYLLNISATDGVYTSFTWVRVDVASANHHNPTFSRPLFEVACLENKPPGTLVTTVTATDADHGNYGKVFYSIESDVMKEYFEINSTTGELSLKSSLDREQQRMYEVPLLATDGGGRRGFTSVQVKVADVNDNAPRFLLREYAACIFPNMTVGNMILKLTAIDADTDLSGSIEYSLYEARANHNASVFGIQQKTGELFLNRSASRLENHVFQFFVRAQDRGNPPLSADVPVEIYIMGHQDIPPVFERRDMTFYFSENSPPGTAVTQLRMVGNSTGLRFRLLSADHNPDFPDFTVEQSGEIRFARQLDREEYPDPILIAVAAETYQSSPPLTNIAEVTVKLLDVNDNKPQFHSNPYVASVAENVPEGTSIIKLVATDMDQGSNADIRYSFAPSVGDLANIFSIHAYPGWLSILVPLDRETRDAYELEVVATDNGKPRLSSVVNVKITVTDYNDSPLHFAQNHYAAAVNEDALPGNVVLQLKTLDEDLEQSTPVIYYITSGDPQSQFQIRQTGEIYVGKTLDRESVPTYTLEVTATDGTFVTTTQVTIDILDANDNPPFCLQQRYREILPESAHPGTYVTTIEAKDIDEGPNARLRYRLSGEEADHFWLDKHHGYLKTSRPLDREEKQEFNLVVHVTDRDSVSSDGASGGECVSQVLIIVGDINDNAPEFSQTLYNVAVSEDAEVKTLVTKVHATDSDLGVNRKVRYSFLDSANGHFVIDADSGIIMLGRPLDREEQAVFNLTVQAVDQGTPSLVGTSLLTVIVLDINDNPPEFASRLYLATITELAGIGTEVARVLATSKDTGINAQVTYSIIGGNERRHFDVHPQTGVILVAQQLDYERAKEYILTVQATDGGLPPLSNQATVNITISDANDNAPVFAQSTYTAVIREDALIGDKLLQLTSTDLDSGDSGRVFYYIVRGDRHKQFAIDETTGYISVASHLDREMVSTYVLEVLAHDHGTPSLSSSVMINIDVSDANDNAPQFTQDNYTAIVQEDKQLGYTVLKLHVTDSDASPNGAPFTFDIRSGNEEGAFRIVQDGSLRTATRFNHRFKDEYNLWVRVFDNGTPILYSDTWINVKIIEESQYPPVITPLEVWVKSFLDAFPGGVVGKIQATDQDPYDSLKYSIVSPSPPPPSPQTMMSPPALPLLFEVDQDDGTIVALPGLDAGSYALNVSVSDGKYFVYQRVEVIVEAVTEEMIQGAVTIRLSQLTPEEFVLSYHRSLIRAMKNALDVRAKDVIVISVQPSFGKSTSKKPRKQRDASSTQSNVDVLLAVRRPHGGYFPAEYIRRRLAERGHDIKEATGLLVEQMLPEKHCTPTYCANGQCIDRIILDGSKVVVVTTNVNSFVSPQHDHRVECRCRKGYGGDRCESIVNECAREPCPPYKVCIPDTSSDPGYSCQCPDGYGGPTCQLEIARCLEQHCYEPREPRAFRGKSYAQYSLTKSIERQFSISMRFRTVYPTGTLMYAGGKIDYMILELTKGSLQLRMDLGLGEGVIGIGDSSMNYDDLTDGQWHLVAVERDGASVRLVVDGKYQAIGSARGANDLLNMETPLLFIGGEVHPHPTIPSLDESQHGFTGCIDDIRLDHIPLPIHQGGASSVANLLFQTNVEMHCSLPFNIRPGPCGSQPCVNGGTCEDIGVAGFKCLCHTRFAGLLCELDLDPCSSSPCLQNSRCTNTHDGSYLCECSNAMLSGSRCQFGLYCNPNPCRNGGWCEEATFGHSCKCRGFTGDRCEIDLNECSQSPCLNGGTCVNRPGSFQCVCGPNATGPYCNESLYTTPIVSNRHSITIEEVFGILGSLLVILFLVILFIIYRHFRVKRPRRHPPGTATQQNDTHAMKDMKLNSERCTADQDFKRCSKVSNIEIQANSYQRPNSYTPSTNIDYLATAKKLERNLSYGSAAEELETLPQEYLHNLNTCKPIHNSNAASVTQPIINSPPIADGDLRMWRDDSVIGSKNKGKEAYYDANKINNDLKSKQNVVLPTVNKGGKTTPSPSHQASPPPTTNTSNTEEFPPATNAFNHRLPPPPSNYGEFERSLESLTLLQSPPGSEKGKKGYHWDCSDWASQSPNQPLPNITEVPGSEHPDSSSFHSNESNESNSRQGSGIIIPNGQALSLSPVCDVNSMTESPSRSDDLTDKSDLFTSSKDTRQPFHLNNMGGELNHIDDIDDDEISAEDSSFLPSSPSMYNRHPNSYLPPFNIGSETEEEGGDGGYGFPASNLRNGFDKRRGSERDSKCASELVPLTSYSVSEDQVSLSIGGCPSTSDLSNICDIDDSETCFSEFESEPTDRKQVNWPPVGTNKTSLLTQTQV